MVDVQQAFAAEHGFLQRFLRRRTTRWSINPLRALCVARPGSPVASPPRPAWDGRRARARARPAPPRGVRRGSRRGARRGLRGRGGRRGGRRDKRLRRSRRCPSHLATGAASVVSAAPRRLARRGCPQVRSRRDRRFGSLEMRRKRRRRQRWAGASRFSQRPGGSIAFGGDRGRWKQLTVAPRAPSPRRAAPWGARGTSAAFGSMLVSIRAPSELPIRDEKHRNARRDSVCVRSSTYNVAVAIERRRRAIRREFVRRKTISIQRKGTFAPALPVASLVPPRANDRVPLRARIVQIAHVYWGARRRRRRRLGDRTRRRDGGEEPGVASVSDKIRTASSVGASSSLSPSPRAAGASRARPASAAAHAHALDAATHLPTEPPPRSLRGTGRPRAPRSAEERARANRHPSANATAAARRDPSRLSASVNRQRPVCCARAPLTCRGGDQLGNQAQRERARGKTRAARRKIHSRLRLLLRRCQRSSLGGASGDVSSPPHPADGPISAISASAIGASFPRTASPARTRRIDEVQERQPRERRRDGDEFAPPADAERRPSARPRARGSSSTLRLARIHAPAHSACVSRRRASRTRRRSAARAAASRASRRRVIRRGLFAFAAAKDAKEPTVGGSVSGRRRRAPLAPRRAARGAGTQSLRGRGATPRARARRAPARARRAVVLAVRQLRAAHARAARPLGSARTRAAWRRVDVAARLSRANATAASSESGASSVSASAPRRSSRSSAFRRSGIRP